MSIVKHKMFGEGMVVACANGSIEIDFGDRIRKFVFPDAFDGFLSTDDGDLKEKIEEARAIKKAQELTKAQAEEREQALAPTMLATKARATVNRVFTTNTRSTLVGPRAQTIEVSSEEEMFQLVGYMAAPNRIGSIEAEIPKDGRDKEFERLFPGQKYRPIEMGETPSGMPNKLSPQFRINFLNLRNCPRALKANMGVGNGSCVGRINKSRFVISIVENYGFRFGDYQDYSQIRRIAEDRGFLDAFNKGVSL